MKNSKKKIKANNPEQIKGIKNVQKSDIKQKDGFWLAITKKSK